MPRLVYMPLVKSSAVAADPNLRCRSRSLSVRAESRLSEAAAAAVNALLPESANGDLGSECSWADDVRYRMQAWDTNIIETSETTLFNSTPEGLIAAIQANITGEWADQITAWETCSNNMTACPDTYVYC
ncbi:hypothetical protein RHMOL_Rhmol09G0155000 [Rhododendron molle]|uniref:Uncharacterized protein n=1 Tax=Rhododendron molle TaxID=49168 RepID=A0ACC0MET5_RHOML|nr:hypothetical protein RHMOL_Rhmol09G0155000 [Rhododendron molle]